MEEGEPLKKIAGIKSFAKGNYQRCLKHKNQAGKRPLGGTDREEKLNGRGESRRGNRKADAKDSRENWIRNEILKFRYSRNLVLVTLVMDRQA